MFYDTWKPHQFECFDACFDADRSDGIQPSKKPSTLKLKANCFHLSFKEIHHYHYSFNGEAAATAKTDPQQERKLLESAWSQLETKLKAFCIRAPGHVFSPAKVDDFQLSCHVKDELLEFTMSLTWQKSLPSATGAASVVGQHLLQQLAMSREGLARKVGRRLYKQVMLEGGKGSLNMLHSMSILHSHQPLLQLDLMNRPVHEKTLIDDLRSLMPGTDVTMHSFDNVESREIKNQWLETCVSAIVVTTYNSRIYKIKQVHFDMHPESKFILRRKGEGDIQISLQEYVESFYKCRVRFKAQPVLEAFPDKPSERVFLLPELCHLLGADDDTNQKRLMETLKRLKAFPQERFAILQGVAKDLKDQDICKKWGCSLEEMALPVQGRALDKWYVAFSEEQKFLVDDDGNFAKWLRHGLQSGREIVNWVLIYPEMDEPVLDVWINSLRSTAQSGFSMNLGEPSRYQCSDPWHQLADLLERRVNPWTQFVLLMTPPNDSWKVYRLFKEWTCCGRPVPSQVIKSDTIRKRQSTGMILARIAQQMNAKSWGPLWHISPNKDGESPAFQEFYAKPTMILGINIYQTASGHRWLGLVASTNRAMSQWYSGAKEVPDAASLSLHLQQLFHQAVVDFVDVNEQQPPHNFVVYRAFVGPKQWPFLEQVEFKSMQKVLDVVRKAGASEATYAPEMTYIAVAQKDDMRIFLLRPDEANIANPDSGTVLDDPRVCPGPFPSFYTVNQSTSKGTAVPAHFTVLKKSSRVTLDLIEALTYRLSLLYYGSNAATRLPAPVMYAKRLAKFVGTVLRQEPRPELAKTLYYL